MRLLLISDEEDKYLWDFYRPGHLDGVDLILSAGDLKPNYLSFLVTMANRPLLYVHGNHDGQYDRNPPEGCECIDDRLVVVSYGTLPFVGAPREVFSHGEELNELGLSVPAVNRVFARIRAAGIDLDPAVYTVDQAKAALLKALARKGGR